MVVGMEIKGFAISRTIFIATMLVLFIGECRGGFAFGACAEGISDPDFSYFDIRDKVMYQTYGPKIMFYSKLTCLRMKFTETNENTHEMEVAWNYNTKKGKNKTFSWMTFKCQETQ